MDARLNLPVDGFSSGVRRLVAEGVANNSYEATLQLVKQASGAKIAQRQAEELAVKAAVDFDGPDPRWPSSTSAASSPRS